MKYVVNVSTRPRVCAGYRTEISYAIRVEIRRRRWGKTTITDGSCWNHSNKRLTKRSKNVEKSESINELATSLAKAQGAVKAAMKDANNPFYKSKYADLSSVWEACRKALSDNGLSVTQLPFTSEGSTVGIETVLLHSSGQYLGEKLVVPVGKYDAQGIGSAITYARRYALSAIVGVVADEDDDGEKAVGRNGKTDDVQPAPVVKLTAEVKQKFQEQIADCLSKGDDLELRNIWDGFTNDEKVVLWGLLNSQQRRTFKELTKQ